MTEKMLCKDLTRSVIGAAMDVLNELRPGLDEKIYENALALDLRSRGHSVEQQRNFPVRYRGQHVGTSIPDMIVDNTVIVDPKVVTDFCDTHISQMLGYLNITNLQIALLLNFKHTRLAWKRVINTPSSESSAESVV